MGNLDSQNSARHAKQQGAKVVALRPDVAAPAKALRQIPSVFEDPEYQANGRKYLARVARQRLAEQAPEALRVLDAERKRETDRVERELLEASRTVTLDDASVAAIAARLAPPPAPPSVTFGAVAKQLTSGELSKLYPDHVETKKTSEDDARMLEVLSPALGEVPLTEFVRRGVDLADEAMRRLDELRQARDDRRAQDDGRASRKLGPLSKPTRRQYAQVIHRVLAVAAYPVRAIPVNPLPTGWLPGVGKRKARGWLYPDEDARLVGCVRVPLVRRVFYGFLNREGMRTGEAFSLRWQDLDLHRGVVKLDENKTDNPRQWPLARGTREALLAWKHLCGAKLGTALVFDPKIRETRVDKRGHERRRQALYEYRTAEDLRDDLRAALGVDARPELFEHTSARRRLRAHDLRATFVTIALAIGKTEAWVTQRTGHTSSQQLRNYQRDAATLRELSVGELTPLNEAIPELREALLSGEVAGLETAPEGRVPLAGATARNDEVGHDRLELSANGLRVRCSTN
jgi:integrase